jgi:hypothetical protein
MLLKGSRGKMGRKFSWFTTSTAVAFLTPGTKKK